MESRSSSSAASSAFESATRAAICWLRRPSTPETLLALPRRLRSWASRLFSVSEKRATPSSAGLTSDGVSLKVFANVDKAEDNWAVSNPLISVVRSPSASGRSYGEWVRSSGMVPASFPSPREVSSSILAPSMVSVLIAASVRSPNDDEVTDREADANPGALRFDVGDPADTHAGNPDGVALSDATGLRRVCRVIVGVLDEGQPVVLEGGDGHTGQDDETHRSDRPRASPAAGSDLGQLHCGVHRPLGWPTSLTKIGLPPFPLTFSRTSQK